MKTTKKALRRRAKLCYTGAIVAGFASLLVASGVETAATFGGMIGYSLAAVAVFALALPCVGYARWLEMEAAAPPAPQPLAPASDAPPDAPLPAPALAGAELYPGESLADYPPPGQRPQQPPEDGLDRLIEETAADDLPF